MSKSLPTQRLRRRSVSDANFEACLKLAMSCCNWGDCVKAGQRVSYNEVNMIHVPMEVMEALARHIAATDAGELGETCRGAVAWMDETRALFDVAREAAKEGAQ